MISSRPWRDHDKCLVGSREGAEQIMWFLPRHRRWAEVTNIYNVIFQRLLARAWRERQAHSWGAFLVSVPAAHGIRHFKITNKTAFGVTRTGWVGMRKSLAMIKRYAWASSSKHGMENTCIRESLISRYRWSTDNTKKKCWDEDVKEPWHEVIPKGHEHEQALASATLLRLPSLTGGESGQFNNCNRN